MGQIRLLYIASSHGRFMAYHLRMVDRNVVVKGIWTPGIKIAAMASEIDRRRQEIVLYRPSHIIFHLLHNDICFHVELNSLPTSVPAAVGELMSEIRKLRMLVPDAIVMASCPFPRLPARGFTSSKCFEYNRLAVRASEQLASERFHVVTIFTSKLWENVKNARTGSSLCIRTSDGLHLTYTGKREVAKEWLYVCHNG